MTINPTFFSGAYNTGDYVITNKIDQGRTTYFSSIPEGYCLSSQDLERDFIVKNNKIIPPRNPLFQRSDFWPNYNWDKSRTSQLNTVTGTDFPTSGTSGIACSQLNTDILENIEKVSVGGVSSTLQMFFGKRPAYVQQFVYTIPSLGTSAFVLMKPGTDTGAGTNVAEWTREYSSAPIMAGTTSAITKYTIPNRGLYVDEITQSHRSNPTRGGVAGNNYSSADPILGNSDGLHYYPDGNWAQSPSIYRNYSSGTTPNGIASAAFESCVIPFDFTNYPGGEDGQQQNTDHGGDFQHPSLYKNQRNYEKLTVNYSGIEGVIEHKMWHYIPRVPPSGEYGQVKYSRDVGPGVPHIFNKFYLYNYYRETIGINGMTDIDLGISGGIENPIFSAVGNFSSTVSDCFYGSQFTMLVEDNSLPPMRGLYDGGTQWETNIFKCPTSANLLSETSDLFGVRNYTPEFRVYLRNMADNVPDWKDKGQLFFNWIPFSAALATNNQELADLANYYCAIFLKDTANFANPGGLPKPYVGSGPLCMAVLAKGDTDLKNYYIDPATGYVIYKGNGLSGDFNQFGFTHQAFTLSNFKSFHLYNTSSDGNAQLWMGHRGNVVTFTNCDHSKKVPGWGGWKYYYIFGKDVADVKFKIDKLISSGVVKARPIFDVPEVIVKNVPPLESTL